mgnify:FL=1
MMRSIDVAGAVILWAFLAGCGSSDTADRSHDSARQMVKHRSIEEVLAAHTPEWMAIAGVIGTGIGECDGAPCIKVLIVQQSDSLARRIPSEVDGYPVRLEVTGEIRAQ